MTKTCPFCGGEVNPSKVRVAPSGKNVGLYDGYRCEKCGEEFLAESSLQSAHDEIVKAGMFGQIEHSISASPSFSQTVVIYTVASSTAIDGPRISGIKPVKPLITINSHSVES